MVWVARRQHARLRQDGVVAALADDVAGRRLAIAMRFVDEVTAFEQDPPGAS